MPLCQSHKAAPPEQPVLPTHALLPAAPARPRPVAPPGADRARASRRERSFASRAYGRLTCVGVESVAYPRSALNPVVFWPRARVKCNRFNRWKHAVARSLSPAAERTQTLGIVPCDVGDVDRRWIKP